ncbi:MAG TPA: arginine--tRNA ligase [Candidatus Paceibacterota bacterium]|nr:arginine--tRNA ligase [Candidatus Paceibacterota bacterium]
MHDVIADIVKKALGTDSAIELSVPEDPKFGHYSTNVAMRLAKGQGKKPLDLAFELSVAVMKAAPEGFFEKVEAVAPGFINFWLSPLAIREELLRVAREKDFGSSAHGKKKTVIVEYSSVNIAKTMNLGHFRTTIIGEAIANLLTAQGYRVVRWNYLGDWGTQFGKLIAAYKLWGDQAAIKKNPVEELQKLYVRFHEEAKRDESLEKRGQEEFQRLEAGDEENRKLWEWFKKESLKEFKVLYAMLGVKFDEWIGESFFEKKMKAIAEELVGLKIAERSEGALVVKLDEFNLPPALIEKSDGASVYITRDIANLEYRLDTFKPSKILYVVANEQALHFEQLFAVAKSLGWTGKEGSPELTHVKYGLVLGEGGKKLSTREGRSVSMKQAIDKAVTLAREIVEKKNEALTAAEKDAVARAVGLGALRYNDLKENRMTDIIFDWDKMLDFSGDSGPYLQYTYARLKSIIRKSGVSESKLTKTKFGMLSSEFELALARKIFELPQIIAKASELYSTSILATYLYRLAVAANKFYETTPIVKDENKERMHERLALVLVAAKTLANGLKLLGIETPEQI